MTNKLLITNNTVLWKQRFSYSVLVISFLILVIGIIIFNNYQTRKEVELNKQLQETFYNGTVAGANSVILKINRESIIPLINKDKEINWISIHEVCNK